MQFRDLKIGDIFKLGSSYPTDGPDPKFMKVGNSNTSMDNAVHYDGFHRGTLFWAASDTSVEVIDISHG